MQDVTRPENELYYIDVEPKSICFIVESEDRRPPLKCVLTVDRKHIIV